MTSGQQRAAPARAPEGAASGETQMDQTRRAVLSGAALLAGGALTAGASAGE